MWLKALEKVQMSTLKIVFDLNHFPNIFNGLCCRFFSLCLLICSPKCCVVFQHSHSYFVHCVQSVMSQTELTNH